MKTSTKQILEILKIISWIIFIGLCIQTGAIIISFFVSLFINPEGAKDLYLELDLSSLYTFSLLHYINMIVFIIALSGLKAYLFYLVIKIFSKINLVHPFSTNVASLIMKISYVALEIGVLALISNGYAKWLMKKGIHFSYDGGSAEFLFLAGIIFVIAQIFKRGIEIQSENELTV